MRSVRGLGELERALCRRDYERLERRHNARAAVRRPLLFLQKPIPQPHQESKLCAQERRLAEEAREQEAAAPKVQALWRGRQARAAQQTQMAATELLLELQMMDDALPPAPRALPL